MSVVAMPLEELVADSVLLRRDSPELAEALSGRQQLDEDVHALVVERDADQAQLLELAAHYADKKITMAEWIEARTRIEARITQADRRLRNASSNPALADLTGEGGLLRDGWVDLDLEVQSTIVRAVVDHIVISPGVLGARSLDPNRVGIKWRH